MQMDHAYHRSARRQCPENLVDAARVIEVATRYPTIEVEDLAERFGVSGRTIYNVLDRAGIKRGDEEPKTPTRGPDHPWRPTTRRKPAAIAMSKQERQRFIDDFLAKNDVTKIPRGVRTADVVFLDTIHE